MKHRVLLLAVCTAATICTGTPPAKPANGFERMKEFLGSWKGNDSQGNHVASSFRLVADQTAIMETFTRAEANESIVRVYYLDNGTLMLTQYGTRGDQPRMRLDRQKSGDTTLVFSMLDVTNTGHESPFLMRDLLVHQSERSLLAESWTVRRNGVDEVETAVLERSSMGTGGAALERMKSLVGTWKGKDPHGNRVDVTYTVVADSTAIMESLDIGGTKESMVTVYTLNDGNTVLTHYCSMGNQPRMKLDAQKSDENTLVYAYVDATNVKSERDPKMHDLTLRFKDWDHFSQEWFLRIEGKNTSTVYEFERVKTAGQSSGW